MQAIIAGISSSSIYRLKKTFEVHQIYIYKSIYFFTFKKRHFH